VGGGNPGVGNADAGVGKGGEKADGLRRHFRQNEVKLKTAKDRGKIEQPEDVKRVLSKIF